MINSSGLALEKIIADILNLSKIDSGKIDIEHAPFSLRLCVQDICAFFAPRRGPSPWPSTRRSTPACPRS